MKYRIAAFVLSTASLAVAAPAADSSPMHQASLEQRVADPHPTIPAPSPWPGAMALLIIGMFGMALGVGMMVEINMPEEDVPDTHSHDEPPGAIIDDPHDAHLHGRH